MRRFTFLLFAFCGLLLCSCGQRMDTPASAGQPWPSHAPESTPYVCTREEAVHRHLEESLQDSDRGGESWEETLDSIYSFKGCFRMKDWEKKMFEELPQDEPYNFVIHTLRFLRGDGGLEEHIALAQEFVNLGCEAQVKQMDAIQDGKHTIDYITVVTATPAHMWELADTMDQFLFIEQLYESVDYRFDTVVWPEA